MTERLYTLKETAGLLKVTTKTMYTYIKAGKVEAVRIGGRWRVTAAALASLLHTDGERQAAATAADLIF